MLSLLNADIQGLKIIDDAASFLIGAIVCPYAALVLVAVSALLVQRELACRMIRLGQEMPVGRLALTVLLRLHQLLLLLLSSVCHQGLPGRCILP